MKLDVRLLLPGPGNATILLADGALPAATMEQPEEGPSIGLVRRWLVSELGLTTPVLEVHPRWEGVPDDEPVPTLAWLEPSPTDWQPPVGWAFAPMPDGVAVQALLADLPQSVRPRAHELLAEIRAGSPPPDLRPRWARHGWFDRASAWLSEVLAARGRPLTAPPEPFYLRGISALLLGHTAEGDVYLKAVFPPFHAEPAISEALAGRFPRAVPRVLATEPAEGWLLVDDVAAAWIGELPADEKPAALALGAAALVRLQREIGEEVDAFVAAGAPRRPLSGLAASLEAVLAPDGVVGDRALEDVRRNRIVDATRTAVEHVERLGLPTTLVHGDFHPGNAALRDGEVVIIDWSDGAIGNPAIDLVTWLAWSRDEPAEQTAAVDGWIEAWSDVADPTALRRDLDAILIVGGAYQVVSYDGILRALEPATRYTMAGAAEHYLKQIEERLPSGGGHEEAAPDR